MTCSVVCMLLPHRHLPLLGLGGDRLSGRDTFLPLPVRQQQEQRERDAAALRAQSSANGGGGAALRANFRARGGGNGVRSKLATDVALARQVLF